MLPNHALSTTSKPGTFLTPRNFLRSQNDRALAPQAIGGAALNNLTQGLAFQPWAGSYDGANVILTPELSGGAITVAIDFVAWFDFCFDQSMNPVIAYAQEDGTTHFRWFDSTIPGYRVTDLPAGTDPWPYCSLDDSRPLEIAASDVVVSYTNVGTLYFLAQRDRFGTVYTLGAVPAGTVMVQAGMSNVNRYQFEFAELLPPIPQVLNLQGKFVSSAVFLPVVIPNAGALRPRIYMPQEDVIIRTRS